VAYPAARCNSTNPAVAIAHTAESFLVICETVTNAGVQYTLTSNALVITRGATQLADEAMLLYWSN